MTKSDIFKLPVEAEVVSREEFEQTKTSMNSRVRNRLTDSINMSKTGVMARYREEVQRSEEQKPVKTLPKKTSESMMQSEARAAENNQTQDNMSEM